MDCTQILDSSEPDEKVVYEEGVKVGILKVNGTEHAIFSGKNRIGRDPEFCRVILNSMALSKEHAIIEALGPDCHYIYDLGSKNHTKLNKKNLEPHVRYDLTDKALLQFGDVQGEYFIADNTFEKSDPSVICESDESLIADTPAPARSRIIVTHPNVVPSSITKNANEEAGSEVRGKEDDDDDDDDLTDAEDIFSDSPHKTAPPGHQQGTEESKRAGVEEEKDSSDSSKKDVEEHPEFFDKSPTPSPSVLQENSIEESIENIQLHLNATSVKSLDVDQSKLESISRNQPETLGEEKKSEKTDEVFVPGGELSKGASCKLAELYPGDQLSDISDDETQAFLDVPAQDVKDTDDTKRSADKSCGVKSVVDSSSSKVAENTSLLVVPKESSSGKQPVAAAAAADDDDDDDETDDALWNAVAQAENAENQPQGVRTKTGDPAADNEREATGKTEGNKEVSSVKPVLSDSTKPVETDKNNIQEEGAKISELNSQINSDHEENKSEEIWDALTEVIPVKTDPRKTLEPDKKKNVGDDDETWDAPTQKISSRDAVEKEDEDIWVAPTQVIPVKSRPGKNLDVEKSAKKNGKDMLNASAMLSPSTSHMDNKTKTLSENVGEKNVGDDIWNAPTQVIPVKNSSGKNFDTEDKSKSNVEDIWDAPTQRITNEKEKKVDERIWDEPTQIIPVKTRPNEKEKKIDEQIWDEPTQMIPVKTRPNEKEKKIDEKIWDEPTQIIPVKTRPRLTLGPLKEGDKKSSATGEVPAQGSPGVGNNLDKQKKANDKVSGNVGQGDYHKRQSGSNEEKEQDGDTTVWKIPTQVASPKKMKPHIEKGELEMDKGKDDIWDAPTQKLVSSENAELTIASEGKKDESDEMWDVPTQIVSRVAETDSKSEARESSESLDSVSKHPCSTPKTAEGNRIASFVNRSTDSEVSVDNESPCDTGAPTRAEEVEDVSDDSRTPSPSTLNSPNEDEEFPTARRVLRLRLSTIDEASEKSGSSLQTEGKLSFSGDGSINKSDSGVFNDSAAKSRNLLLVASDASDSVEVKSEKTRTDEEGVFVAPGQRAPVSTVGSHVVPEERERKGREVDEDKIWDAPTQKLPREGTEEVSSEENANIEKLSPSTAPVSENKIEGDVEEKPKIVDKDKLGDIGEETQPIVEETNAFKEEQEKGYESDASYGSVNEAPTQAIDDLTVSAGKGKPTISHSAKASDNRRSDVTSVEQTGGYESDASYGSVNEAPTQAIDDLLVEMESTDTRNNKHGKAEESEETRQKAYLSTVQEIDEAGSSETARAEVSDTGRKTQNAAGTSTGEEKVESKSPRRRKQSFEVRLHFPSTQELLDAEEQLMGGNRGDVASAAEASSPVINGRGKSKRCVGKSVVKKGRKCSDSIVSSPGPDQSLQSSEDSTEVTQSHLRKRAPRKVETAEANVSSDEGRPRRHQKLTWKLKENLINDLEEGSQSSPVRESSRMRGKRSPKEHLSTPPAAKKSKTADVILETSTPKLPLRKRETFDRKQEASASKANTSVKPERVRGLSESSGSEVSPILPRRGTKSRTKRFEKSLREDLSVSIDESLTAAGRPSRRSKVKKEEVSEEKKTERKRLISGKATKKTEEPQSSPDSSQVVRVSARKSRLKTGAKTAEAADKVQEVSSAREPRRASQRRKTEETPKPVDLNQSAAKRQRTSARSTVEELALSPKVMPSRQKKSQRLTVGEVVSDSESTNRRSRRDSSLCSSPQLERVSTSLRGTKRRMNSSLESSETESQASTPKRSSRSVSNQSHCIMFTGVTCSAADQRAVKKLGGKIVEDPRKCTVLVTDKVRRTFKFLCMMSQGKPIVSTEWLKNSQSSGQFADPWDFLVKDTEAEKKFKFSLGKSLKLAASEKLLDGYSVVVTTNVKPPPEEMKGIVECCGGVYFPQNRSSALPEKSFIISCEEDKKLWSKFKKSVPVVSAEVILLGVLQHKINVKAHILK